MMRASDTSVWSHPARRRLAPGWAAVVAGLAAAATPGAASAYVGPGLAVGTVWVLLGPIAALVVLLILIGYFPVRYLYKRLQHKRGGSSSGDAEGDDDGDSRR